jgi:multisubunit Na+/H+ antiporter MnhG subunit
METKPIVKKLSIALYAILAILLLAIILGWFVDYPKWLDQLISNIMLVSLGIVLFIQAYRIRNKDPKFSAIYLIIGALLILVAFLSLAFVKIIAIVGLAFYLLTNSRVQGLINKKEHSDGSGQ